MSKSVLLLCLSHCLFEPFVLVSDKLSVNIVVLEITNASIEVNLMSLF